MTNRKIYFVTLTLLFLLISCLSCSKSRSSYAQKESVSNKYLTANNGKVVSEDTDTGDENQLVLADKNSSEIPRMTSDGSQIKVSYDGFGNKTETRTFYDNPLLKLVLLRVGIDGGRQIFVYGQSGEVKILPVNMSDKFSTASAKELADAAGISEPPKENFSFVRNTQQPTTAALKPLPSSAFLTQNQQVEQSASKGVEHPADTGKKIPPTNEEVSQPRKNETSALDKNDNER